METDYVSASGWIVHTGGLVFKSERRVIQLAFEDFLATVKPRAIGGIVYFTPVGLPETDDNTVVALSKTLMKTLPAMRRPAARSGSTGRSRLGGAELEKLQRWGMHLADEFKEILDEVDALKTEPLADHSDARQRREGSPASLPDGPELQEAVEELVSEAREYAAREADIDRRDWFGPIEQVILQATAYLGRVADEVDRILEAAACRHLFNCRCQRQLKLYEERIEPAVKEWIEFMAQARALRKRR